MELSKNVKIGLGSLAVAMVLSIFAPIVALRSVPTATAASIGVTAPAPQIDYDGSAGLVWQGWVKWTWPQWGFVTITNPHYGQTYQNPTVFGTHRTLVLKWSPKTWDGNAWVRLHISHPNENNTGCLLIQDSIHTWIHAKFCGPDKWDTQAKVITVIAIGAAWLGWIINQLARIAPAFI